MKAHVRHIRIIQQLMGARSPESSNAICLNLYDWETGCVPLRSVQRDLNQLIDAGLLIRHGNARSSTYHLSDGAYREILEISNAYDRERSEFKKYQVYGIVPRFRFRNLDRALSWVIRRFMLKAK
ncbi:MAG: hypothetical protein O3B41_08315 [Bacteroidetes bacterium]|nr:hypothetical protein [Bacteroidota bacterium]